MSSTTLTAAAPFLGYLPAVAVLVLGGAALTVCARQRDPRVPFIAMLALIVFVLVSAGGMLVGFGPRP